jgi:hypothetical protein
VEVTPFLEPAVSLELPPLVEATMMIPPIFIVGVARD